MKPLDRSELRKPGFDASSDTPLGGGTRAIVLGPVLGSESLNGAGPTERTPAARLDEATGLARAIGLDVAAALSIRIPRPRAATLFGAGKVSEIEGLVRAEQAELVIVDHAVTPVQQRNLERGFGAKVLDRTALILEIFGRRARTREGRLQVELAHLTYQKSRLVRSWTHLERQRGGFGFLGGPGETQIEADRRVIQERIDAIRKELATVVRTRHLHREGRRRVPYPLVALVGYTNAGKSSLFNRMTGAEVLAADALFATLDPTIRGIKLPQGTKAALSDTVGFISDLPTSLIAAFRATLEEVISADLIIHVRDIADADSAVQRSDVDIVLDELGIGEDDRRDRLIEVWNKSDLLDDAARSRLASDAQRAVPAAILTSATSGEGIDALLRLIEQRLNASHQTMRLELGPQDGALMHWLYENTQVIDRHDVDEARIAFEVRLSAEKAASLRTRLAFRSPDAA